MQSPFDFLYYPDLLGRDAEAFEGNYTPPEKFEHGEEYLVCHIPALNTDGTDADIYEMRFPCRFYRIQTADFEISTGSITGQFAYTIGKAIAEGMIVVKTKGDIK